MIFNLAKVTHCSPGRAVSLVCEAMRSFLVRTLVAHMNFVWLIFQHSFSTITHMWFKTAFLNFLWFHGLCQLTQLEFELGCFLFQEVFLQIIIRNPIHKLISHLSVIINLIALYNQQH